MSPVAALIGCALVETFGCEQRIVRFGVPPIRYTWCRECNVLLKVPLLAAVPTACSCASAFVPGVEIKPVVRVW